MILYLSHARAKKAEGAVASIHDSGIFQVPSRILLTSPRYGAPQRGPGLSGNLDSSAFAQLVGTADALAGGMHPSGKRTPLDGHFHPRYFVPPGQSQIAPQSRASRSLGLLRLPEGSSGAGV